jgi:hypothetical protein
MSRREYQTLKWGLIGRSDSVWAPLAITEYQLHDSAGATTTWRPKASPAATTAEEQSSMFFQGFKRKEE